MPRVGAAEVLRIKTKWRTESTQARLNAFKRAEALEHHYDCLQKGVPER